jgi:hypothetical protein
MQHETCEAYVKHGLSMHVPGETGGRLGGAACGCNGAAVQGAASGEMHAQDSTYCAAVQVCTRAQQHVRHGWEARVRSVEAAPGGHVCVLMCYYYAPILMSSVGFVCKISNGSWFGNL